MAPGASLRLSVFPSGIAAAGDAPRGRPEARASARVCAPGISAPVGAGSGPSSADSRNVRGFAIPHRNTAGDMAALVVIRRATATLITASGRDHGDGARTRRQGPRIGSRSATSDLRDIGGRSEAMDVSRVDVAPPGTAGSDTPAAGAGGGDGRRRQGRLRQRPTSPTRQRNAAEDVDAAEVQDGVTRPLPDGGRPKCG